MNFKKNKKSLVIGLVVVVLLVLVIFGGQLRSGSGNAETERSDRATAVTLIDLAGSDASNRLEVNGQVESIDQASVSSEISGVVSQLLVTVGQSVRRGEVLVSFGTGTEAAQLAQAEAALLAERAQLEEMEAGERTEQIRIQEGEVEQAERDLQETRRQAEQKIASAQEALFNNDLQAYVDDPGAGVSQYEDVNPPIISGNYVGREPGQYRIELYRSMTQSGYSFKFQGPTGNGTASVNTQVPQPLGQSGLYIQFSPDFAYNSSLDWVIPVPNDRSSSYLSVLDTYERALDDKEPTIEKAKTNLARSQDQLELLLSGTRSEQLSAQRARVAQAEANRDIAQVQLNKRVLRAPFNGQVGSVQIRQGESVSPGQALVSLVNDELLRLKVFVDPAKAREISVGDQVVVADQYQASVTAKAPSLNPETGQVEIQVTVSEPSDLVVGEYVKAQIQSGTDSGELWVPLSAVRVSSVGRSVMTVEDGQAVEIPVETGSVSGDRIRITSGLDEGQAIIKDVRQLKPGQSVEVN